MKKNSFWFKAIPSLASGISFSLGFIFITTGVGKITGLPGVIGPNWLIDELSKHQLRLYGFFIAYSQIIIGFFLITNRFRTLGSIMLFPMLINIFVIVVSLKWAGTPIIVAFLIFLNLVLLILDFHKLKFIFSNNNCGLGNVKIKRTGKILDLIYLFPLLLILIGTVIDPETHGRLFARFGLIFILIIILGDRILMLFRKKRKF